MSGLIAHEWIAQSGGSERVLDELISTFPDADLQVLWKDTANEYPTRVYETWIARTPLRRHKAIAIPFILPTWRMLTPARNYEWLLVSSHMFAHHLRLRGTTNIPKLVYAHTPARYLWTPDLDTRGNSRIARLVSTGLRPIDRRRAQESHCIAANSAFTRDRIRTAWRRDAEVIYPPVDTERIASRNDWADTLTGKEMDILNACPTEFLLGASRFVPYKKLTRVLDAGSAANLPVVIAGSGPGEAILRERAALCDVPVTFVIRPSNHLLYALYSRALAYIFPAIEDFGIMPIEAMAVGTPVIAPPVGGAAESIQITKGGALLESDTRTGWVSAIATATGLDSSEIKNSAQRFSRTRFRSEIRQWVSRHTTEIPGVGYESNDGPSPKIALDDTKISDPACTLQTGRRQDRI
ncbi:glycosyltransferase [Gordonia sp. NPDC003424]